jgi:glycogen debranching enzyme
MKRMLAASAALVLILAGAAAQTPAPTGDVQGKYFAKKAYTPKPLPTFAATKALLPEPRFDDQPGYADMYWKAWELAFRNFHEPAAGTGFVSQFIDAAFNQNIFAWDTCFMTLFTNVAHPLVPGIASLDNFYARQHESGEICREIDRATGKDFKAWVNPGKPLYSAWGFNIESPKPPVTIKYVGREAPRIPSKVTLDGLDHPIFAWAEMESYRTTGDKARLALVYEPLVRFYRSLREHLRQGNGLYMTDWASMDNSPRNPYLNAGGTGIDISCEMVLFANEMAEMARLLGRPETEAEGFDRDSSKLTSLIDRLMWDVEKRFYYDLTVDGKPAPIKTVAAFWALLSGVAGGPRGTRLVAELNDPATFGRLHPVPTVAADQPLYNPKGEYWRGSAWAPTTTMVVRGLEKAGYRRSARSLALQDLAVTYQVFAKTGTVWENYAPDAPEPGNQAKPDFVGWSGIAPILYLLEYAVGLKPDAPANTLVWDIQATKRLGCRRYRFNGHVADLDAVPDTDGEHWTLSVRSDGAFTLKVETPIASRTFPVKRGENRFSL